MLQFPFWLVVPAPGKPASPGEQCRNGWLPLAFSSVGKMAAFLSVRKDGQWKVRLVNRYSVESLFRDLEEYCCGAVCHDPNEDGKGGTLVSMADILASLKADTEETSPP